MQKGKYAKLLHLGMTEKGDTLIVDENGLAQIIKIGKVPEKTKKIGLDGSAERAGEDDN
jgi:hypothetical protein